MLRRCDFMRKTIEKVPKYAQNDIKWRGLGRFGVKNGMKTGVSMLLK